MFADMPFVGRLIRVGASAYGFFSDAWEFLTSPLPVWSQSSVFRYIYEAANGLPIVPQTPLDFILGGIGFIIIVKIVRLFWDALPWV